ncbi:EAL domain-containing protein [Aurantimonas sp. A2-1-M11]|uniref:EAL domain-containing protein n=1 Tax=Aurantimonas sp. A2-1-M11 TaxID=3113712 RepID=UPI002F92D9DC
MAPVPEMAQRLLPSPQRTVVLLLIGLGLILADLSGLAASVDARLAELRFQADAIEPTGDIILVDIDAKSLAEIGIWPWPRRLHGELLQAAESAQARSIAYDIDFSTSSSPEDDQAFAAALAGTEMETFLAAFVQPDTASGAGLSASLPIEMLLRYSWPAGVNVPIDNDGRVRRFPTSIDGAGEPLVSMPSLLAHDDATTGSLGIDYAISAGQIPRISYVDLLRNRIAPGSIRGKTLIVGASAIELRDLFPVPVHGIVSGSTIIALATETLLQDRALHSLGTPWFVLAGLALILVPAASHLSSRQAFSAIAGAAVSAELLAFYLQSAHAVVLQTAGFHALLIGLVVWVLSREFNLRRVRLWIARTQAANSQSVLERVLDDGFHGVAIVDEQQRITRINREALELLGLKNATRLDELPSEISDNVSAVVTEFEHGRTTGKPAVHVLHLPGGERVLEYSIVPFWLAGIADPEEDVSGDIVYATLTLRDITERQKAHERIHYMALHDSLTGLGNRRALEQKLEAILGGVAPDGGIALFAFDLDRFKAVNDALGHGVGDEVLKETARRAEDVLTGSLLIARSGGDEFIAIMPAENLPSARAMAAALIDAIANPFLLSGHRIWVETSVGISWWHGQEATVTSMMRHADVALYRAKRTSGEKVVTFEPPMDGDRLQRLKLEEDLNEALNRHEFKVVYQPQLRLSSEEIVGAEALVRWTHAERGFVSPVEFIPVAEETGLIHRLGAWVLETACVEAMRWPKPIKVAVNVSAIQFAAGDLVAAVRQALTISGLPPERLELEITESAFVEESDKLHPIFEELLAIGVSFALDDFGTGYSSLGYLQRFPISKIKIDRSFVTDILTSNHSIAVIRSVMALAEGLDIRTIAEGIETPEQATMLRLAGCNDGQGYLFAKPIEGSAIAEMMEASHIVVRKSVAFGG